jgi:L-fucose mutarotase/ribose pyranase (RbsD/FucU family)
MRVLLDESVPKALGFALEPHYVRTAQAAGFAGLLNGELLTALKAAGYDVLITFDQNVPYQQNADLPVPVVVLRAQNNRVETALKFVPKILAVLASKPPPGVVVLDFSE